ncbi:MAG TPA: type II toxin-antitoxin system VapC family toxin [Candidatus Paceibacterota bacterium]|nr:type II toxin-antitoxin system VapC family toxin [Verrucomicrobiota bacterium]HOX02807.1 type II toxin-antitoxin system VapC family toxin [Verrucomicrobiota bacterium]HRZ45515.1 type II toxin-antitoxin system VapC family toxin [Candidatus Paceibacterota bacterium]HRZ93797.1 type II toxin-antitoxin system VapC family toxin [Candidatus Paceibacterota bacterium]
MKMLDVNILVYAHRKDEAAHEFYRDWLERQVNTEVPFGLSALVGVAFVRIVTHPSFHNDPTPLPVALATVDCLRQSPGCRWLLPGERHWEITAMLCRKTGAAGKQVADAQHAALAIEHGCRWVTRDDDFAVFAPHGLEWEHLRPGEDRGPGIQAE